ncbi:CVNH domain-containing protein [Limnofasciculus baicalensis]|uniref:CVNH domain-containing protein n=1 Tax=Limnofasciculus baicalensis BBK-W-15 TaxID=2699891 RepID=A0AAE3GQZ0_9CYAN|nr:CVNH domain-containing protein [Limnofasciculus baicalensis]MCP2729100.1 CVNH domain-containing protein [Limnofasciculus baicalensis BBK-W-15]
MNKVSKIIKIALAFLFAFVLSFNLVVERAMATGEFSQTCEDIYIDDPYLVATCEKADGVTKENSDINLNEYIGAKDGILSWGGKYFADTCDDIALAQSLATKELLLTAQCKKADGIEQSDIELDAHIANIDGSLTYE